MANFTALAAALADVSAALDPLAGQVQQVIAIVQELRNQPPPTEDPAIQAAIDSMVTTVASMTTTINAMVTGLQTVTST